jgi:hypothetical protein
MTVVTMKQHVTTAVELVQAKLEEAQQHVHLVGASVLRPQGLDPGRAPDSNLHGPGDFDFHGGQGTRSFDARQLRERSVRHGVQPIRWWSTWLPGAGAASAGAG